MASRSSRLICILSNPLASLLGPPRIPNAHYSFGYLPTCTRPALARRASQSLGQFCLSNTSEVSVSISLVPPSSYYPVPLHLPVAAAAPLPHHPAKCWYQLTKPTGTSLDFPSIWATFRLHMQQPDREKWMDDTGLQRNLSFSQDVPQNCY